MSQLFYANLPDCEAYEIIRNHAYYKFLDIAHYLLRAIESLKKRIHRLAWEQMKKIESDEDTNKEALSQNENGIWIRLIEPEGKVVDDRIFQEFYRAKDQEVLELLDGIDKLKHDKIGRPIKILGTNPEKAALLLEAKPNSKYIGVKPSTYQLNTQISALDRLQTEPHPFHRSLIRLIERVDRVKWPNVEPMKIDKWYFLADESRPGTFEQREFVEKAIATPDFAILEGPPGSGKTTAICELILQLIYRGKRVLLCASTHVAVDNVLERIAENEKVVAVRIGDKNNISLKARPYQIDERKITEKKEIIDFLSNEDSLKPSQEYFLRVLQSDKSEDIITNLILESANLICGTTIGILQHPEIKKKRFKGKPLFDYLIIDEASKTTFQEFLVPAIFAKKWVLAGDPKQLSPYVDTSIIESNLSAISDKYVENSNVCRDLFYCKDQRVNLIAVENDENKRRIYYEQAEKLGLTVFEINQATKLNKNNILEILGSQVLIGDYECLKKFEPLIPGDFFFCHGKYDFDLFKRRRNHWLKKNPEIAEDIETKPWSQELAWRLVRLFELRRTPDEQEFWENQRSDLLPKWLPELDEQHFLEELNNVRRIAFPSIIELLREGFERNRYQRSGSTLSDGFDKIALYQRHVILTYQHRMHPEISRFPRDFIYDAEALKDPNYIFDDREWDYRRYVERSIWISTKGKVERNQNINEANIIMTELEHLLKWTKLTLKDNGTPWEIAILTFYRAQEKILRKRLQKRFRSKNYQSFNLKNKNTHIELCTVDRFQGHEADVVFLSFVRNRKTGFLDSVNRLNVAITRAKYQLVIVGNQKFFRDRTRSKVLKELALNTRRRIHYSKEGKYV